MGERTTQKVSASSYIGLVQRMLRRGVDEEIAEGIATLERIRRVHRT